MVDDAKPEPPPSGRSRRSTSHARTGARRRSGFERVAATVVAPALLIGLVFVVASRVRRPPASAVDAAAPPPSAEGLATLAAPSCDGPAAAEVRAGRDALRSLGRAEAEPRFEAAAKADATCAEAHLRLAMIRQASSPAEARGAFARAREGQDRLSTRDRDLLHALEPSFDAPPNDLEARKRMRTLAARRGNDAEILVEAARRTPDDALLGMRFAKRATTLDPKYADAWRAYAAAALHAAEIATADEALDRCETEAPAAVACVHDRTLLHRRIGLCDAVEREGRDALTKDRAASWARPLVASAMATKGAARADVEGVLAPRWADAAVEPWARAHERARVAAFYGDFATARAELAALGELVKDRAETAPRAAWALATIDLLEETEERDAAASFASAQAAAAWPKPPPDERRTWAVASLLPRLARLVPSKRDALLASWRESSKGELDEVARWAYGDAMLATDADAARASAARMPRYLAKPPASALDGVDYWTGVVQVVAGRPHAALDPLSLAIARCDAIDAPFEHVRAQDWLGVAYEALRSNDDACKAYASVLARWGAAKTSVTAKHARERAAALGCAKP